MNMHGYPLIPDAAIGQGLPSRLSQAKTLEFRTSETNELLSKMIGLKCKGAIEQGLLGRLMIAFIMIMEPADLSPPLSKLCKCMAVYASLMITEPTAPSWALPKL